MPVIALTQGMGSLAQDVAEQLAEELKLTTLQHEVGERVASRMQVSKSLVNRLREGKAGTLERLKADRESLAVYTAEEVLDSAARGNVVLRGWGATQLLRGVPHVVCVRIARPMAQRVQWLMTHLDIDEPEIAQAEIRRSDHAHAARMNELFGVTWLDPLLFDMVLNTDRLSVDACVQQIRTLVARPEFAPTPQSQALLEGLALQARVRSALRADDAARHVDITIDASAGQLTLRGVVLNAAERDAAAGVAARVPGVLGVDNQLRVLAPSRRFTSAGGS